MGFEPGTNGDVSHISLFLLLLPRLFSFVFCFAFCFVFRFVSCFVFNFDCPSCTLLSTVQLPRTLIRFASLEANEKSKLCLNLLARFSFMLCFFCSILLFQGRHNITKLYCKPEA